MKDVSDRPEPASRIENVLQAVELLEATLSSLQDFDHKIRGEIMPDELTRDTSAGESPGLSAMLDALPEQLRNLAAGFNKCTDNLRGALL